MHTGEEYFTIGWQQYAFLSAVLLTYVVLAVCDKLPSMSSFKDFADVINSAGGNILLLAIFSAWSIQIAMRLFYHLLALPTETITKNEAIATAGMQFVTGVLCGTFLGALIKTLTGGKANGVAPPAQVPDTLVAGFKPADKI